MEFNLVSSLFCFARLEFSTLLRFSCHVSSISVLMNVYETSCLRTLYFVIATIFNAQYTAARRSHDHSLFSSTFTSHDLISILYLVFPSFSHPYVFCVSLFGGRNPLTALFTFFFSSPCRPRACIYVSQQSYFPFSILRTC